ncbi:MAG: hypothetical protein HY584_00745 [Candidatus Omnitrophica bacterium]|nr:hypothetical protein [Candidatus Omnitrophota bacterium]
MHNKRILFFVPIFFVFSLFALSASALAATITLGSDIKATTVTVDTADTADLDGYELDIGTGGITVNGTLDGGTGSESGDTNSTITVEGNWTTASGSTFTTTGSTVIFDGSTADQTVTTNAKAFNNVTINNTNGTATADDIVVSGALDIDGILTVTDGELQVNTTLNIGGNLSIAAAGAVTKGSGATTFDGSASSTWSDSTSGQDLGAVTIDGTTKTISTSTGVKATSITIGADDTYDITGDTLTLIGTGTVLTKNAGGTFTTTTSTVTYAPGSAVATTVASETYNNLTLDDSGSGGSVTFSPSGASLAVGGVLTITDGTLAMTTKTLDVNGNLSVASAGTLSFSSGSMTFAGASFSVSGTFTKGTGTVTFDRDNASGTITIDVNGLDTLGTLSLYNFTYNASANTNAATISVDDTDTVTVQNSMTLKGNSTNRLVLQSDHGTNTVDFDLETNGVQSLDYLTVTRVDSATGLNMIPSNTAAGNCVSTVNWSCGAAVTYTWDGSESTVWSTANNWDVGLKPASDSTATIPDTSNDPVADEAITVTNLTIQTGAVLTISGQNLTVSSTYSNSGTLILNGNETTVSLTNDGSNGLTKFVSGSSITIKNLNPYNNVEFDAASGTPTFTAPAATFDVNGALTITDGTVALGGNALDLEGTLTIGATGALTTTSANLNTAGAVSLASGGSFTKGSGTWTFDGTAAKTYTDSNATPVNIGAITINKTSATEANNKLTLASSMTVDTLTIDGTAGSADTIDLAAGGYTLTLANAGATTTVLTNNGTFTAGTSTVKYTATNSGGNINLANVSYSSLELNGSETYAVGAALSVSENLTVTAGTLSDADNNITIGGDLTIQNGITWTRGAGLLKMSGTGTTPTLTDNRATKGDLGNLQFGA